MDAMETLCSDLHQCQVIKVVEAAATNDTNEYCVYKVESEREHRWRYMGATHLYFLLPLRSLKI